MAEKKFGSFEPWIEWSYLNWNFKDAAQKQEFEEKEYFRNCMPAGVKVDSSDNLYVSVPRWNPGVPATMNKVVYVDGKPLLEPFPSKEMNEEGNPNALQSVLGYEIDEKGQMWILDQGHVCGAPCIDGAQKIVVWDLKADKLVKSIKIPDDIASYVASFLNDIVVDNDAGFAYIADSGIFTDPLEGCLIVYNMKTGELKRALYQDRSTQDEADFWFSIAGQKIWPDKPMRTGADGIALAADRKRLYWCPLTSRNLFSIETAHLQDFSKTDAELTKLVKDHGSKGTNTDGMAADNKGRIWFTMLEKQGIGYYDPEADEMVEVLSDPSMIWVDGLMFNNRGYIIFNHNHLHDLGELDKNKPNNLIFWKAYVGEDVKSYLMK